MFECLWDHGRGDMDRIKLQDLVSGQVLGEPLYDSEHRLLLAPGRALTAEIIATLGRRGEHCLFVGVWDPSDTGLSSTSYKESAELLAQEFDALLADEVSADVLKFNARGQMLDSAIDDMLSSKRSTERISHLKRVRNGGIDIIGQFMSGKLSDAQMPEVADELVHDTWQALKSDANLSAMLLNLQGSGEYLYRHSLNTVILSLAIGAKRGHDTSQLAVIGTAALFHDVGMTKIDTALLDLPRKLTPHEMLDIQKHVGYSTDRLAQIAGISTTAKLVAHQHHERLDGSGYPHRRSGNLIHGATKIVMVADIYDALTNERPWREAFDGHRAIKYILDESQNERLDKECVKALLRYLSLYPIGSYVLLSNGETARVIHSNDTAYSRPVVRVVKDASGKIYAKPYAVDLSKNDDMEIVLSMKRRPDLPEFAGF